MLLYVTYSLSKHFITATQQYIYNNLQVYSNPLYHKLYNLNLTASMYTFIDRWWRRWVIK